jgi:uncharacterized protein involved in exopolysaccharide biosynthesis
MNTSPNKPQTQLDHYTGDEISIADLFNILKSQWKLIGGLAITGCLLAFSITLTIPKLYQAEVLLQIGRAGPANAHANINPVDIETPSSVAQRLNSKGFFNRIAKNIDPSFSVRAFEIAKTKLLRLEVRSRTPETAVAGLQKVLLTLSQDHDPIFEDVKKNLELARISTEKELNALNGSLRGINETALNLSKQNSRDAVLSLLLIQTQSQLAEQRLALLNRLASLEILLSPQNLVKTSPVEPIEVTTSPVYPKTTLILVTAFLAGGLTGILIAFVRSAVREQSR